MATNAFRVSLFIAWVLLVSGCRPADFSSTPPIWVGAIPAATVPAYRLLDRIEVLKDSDYYPCSDCHDGSEEVVATIRTLADEHTNIELKHGDGRFWCLTCHNLEQRDFLVDQTHAKISFNASHRLCGMCHFQQERDFENGAHGKRQENWRGERILTPCTYCHDPHDPAIKPRKPWQPPKFRKGLEGQIVEHAANRNKE